MSKDLDYTILHKSSQVYDRNLDKTNDSYIYGEVNHNSIRNIIDKLYTNEDELLFLDIGSGYGKFIINLSREDKHIHNFYTGIEIHKKRYEHSLELQNKYNTFDNTEFIYGDFKNIYFGNYNFIYCCNTMFGENENKILFDKFLNEYKGHILIFNCIESMKKYIINCYSVDTSWSKNINIYHLFIE